MLANPRAWDQTGGIMKNFPRAAKICAANALVILAVIVIQACAHQFGSGGYGRTFGFEFEQRTQLKDPENFCNTIKKSVSSSALYSFEVVFDNGKSENCCPDSGCIGKDRKVKVDKITTSRMAEESARELTPIGSHVTQRIYSNASEDITLVLAQAKAESH